MLTLRIWTAVALALCLLLTGCQSTQESGEESQNSADAAADNGQTDVGGLFRGRDLAGT